MLSAVDATSPKPAEVNSVSPPDFIDWRQRSTTFTGMTAVRDDGYALTGEGIADQITGNAVTGDFFGVMGVPQQPAAGSARQTPPLARPRSWSSVTGSGGDATGVTRRSSAGGSPWTASRGKSSA